MVIWEKGVLCGERWSLLMFEGWFCVVKMVFLGDHVLLAIDRGWMSGFAMFFLAWSKQGPVDTSAM